MSHIINSSKKAIVVLRHTTINSKCNNRSPAPFAPPLSCLAFFAQSARRPRKATVPMVPEVEEIEGVLTAWKMPLAYSKGGGEAMKGLYVLFHGCSHGPLDW